MIKSLSSGFDFGRLAVFSVFLIFVSFSFQAHSQSLPFPDTRADENGNGSTPLAFPDTRADENGNGSTPLAFPDTRADENGIGNLAPNKVPVNGKKYAEEDSCEDKSDLARAACLMPGVGGMDSGSAAMYTMMMNQLVQLGAQVASVGKNMSQQCKLQADVSKVMGSINGVKGATCMKVMNTCASVCSQELANHKEMQQAAEANNQQAEASKQRRLAGEARRLGEECKSYSGQVGAMMMGAMQNLGNFAVNQQCQSDLAAMAALNPLPTLPPLATVGDCSDPNNQSLACFCTKEANKATAMCAGFGSGTFTSGTKTTPSNGGSVAAPVGSTLGDDFGADTTDPFAAAKKDPSGDQKGQGDGGSGAPGGGGLSALSSDGGGGGGAGDPRSAITGTSGGNGSGLGGSGGGGGANGLARNNGSAGGKEGFFDKFNLKRFLPGSRYKTRGIAGMSVKSVDGITGPMGPTLFEKATRQYQEQIQKQNVILDK